MPWSAAVLFGREAPLEIEVGTGKGLFLAGLRAVSRAEFPGRGDRPQICPLCRGAAGEAKLTGGKVLEGNALTLFRERLPDASVAAVHVYFPDPWWKARHKKRRVLNEQFLRDAEHVLIPGGDLHFWTDVEEYFATSLELIQEVTTLSGPRPVAEQAAADTLDYRTHFERRTRLAGQQVFRGEW